MNSFDAHENNDITFVHVQESNNILNCPISEEEIYIYMYSKSAKITKHGRVEISLIGVTPPQILCACPKPGTCSPVDVFVYLFIVIRFSCLNRLGRLLYFMNICILYFSGPFTACFAVWIPVHC